MAKKTFNQKSTDPATAEKLGQDLLREIGGGARDATIRDLIAAGANLESRDPSGQTPLLLAAARAKNEAAFTLLDAGANPDAASTGGATALFFTTMTGQGNFELAKKLLDHKADPNKIYKSLSSLMWAAQRGFKDIVADMAERGGDITLMSTGAEQKDSIGWAEHNNKTVIANMLRNIQQRKDADARAREAAALAAAAAEAERNKRDTFETEIEGMHTKRAVIAPKVASFKKRQPVPQQ